GLRHEAIDDAMEYDAVVEALAHQFLDPRNMIGSEIRAHLNRHRSLCGFENQSVVVSHALFSFGLGWVRRSSNRMVRGRPAIALPMPEVNGIGTQRCNACITAVR